MDKLQLESVLREYGVGLVAFVLGLGDLPTTPSNLPESLHPKKGQQGKALESIFSLIAPPENKVAFQDAVGRLPRYYALAALEARQANIFPAADSPDLDPTDMERYRQSFEQELEELNASAGGRDAAAHFEAFCHLLRRYGWCLPAPSGQPGVSLYEYFKLVAALKLAQAPGQGLVLVRGSLPGIQDWLYTIQSEGASRTLRGRSFYLQLLSDGISRRLLEKFKLPRTNLLYQGGSKFTLLLPATLDDQPTTALIQAEETAIDQVLWSAHDGKLACVLSWVEIAPGQLEAFCEDSSGFFQELGEVAEKRKAFRFRGLGWETLFKPGDYKYQDEEGLQASRNAEGQPYRDLAKELADADKTEAWLVVSQYPTGSKLPGNEHEKWSQNLWQITGQHYHFENRPKPGLSYAINRTTSFYREGGAGFMFIGNITPRINEQDVKAWQSWFASLTPEQLIEVRENHQDRQPEPNQDIRDYDSLARSALGWPRYGILRMDVDNLGNLFSGGLPGQHGLLEASTLSGMLGLFFENYINTICQSDPLVSGSLEDTLYILYSGGDDLFVVGTWDRLPLLARNIREEFRKYTCHNPALSISGGIAVAQSAGYPLYQAARDADKAEHKAKTHRRPGPGGKQRDRDAISFLGIALDWQEFEKAKTRCDQLQVLVKKTGPDQAEELVAPRALLSNLLNIYNQAQFSLKNSDSLNQTFRQLKTGRWYWRAAYNLKRTVRRADKNLRKPLEDLSDAALDPNQLNSVGLAARWTHLLTRSSEDAQESRP